MKLKAKKGSLVFILHQFQVGGVESVFINISNVLKDRHIYLILSLNSVDSELVKRLPLNVTLINIGPEKQTAISLLRLCLVLRLNYDFRQLHVINFSDTLSTYIIHRSILAKKYSSWLHCNPYALHNSNSFFLSKYFLKKNDHIICLCESQKVALIDLIPEISNKVKVISNIVDKQRVDELAKDMPEIITPYVLMVSRFDLRAKDFFTLIDAYSSLSSKLKQATKLVLLGDGPDRDIVLCRVDKLGESNNIILPGKDTNPFRWMKGARALVHSSLSEGFALVLLEAMTLGVPVVSSNCNYGPSDILEGGKYGFLFEPKSCYELKNILKDVLSDTRALQQYRETSKVRARYIHERALDDLRVFFYE